MGLEEWLDQGRLRRHRTSPQELRDLLAIAERGLADARVEAVSTDGRFASAYSAALSLATIPLAASGYRTTGTGHHSTVFHALPELLGPDVKDLAAYLDLCRARRNETEYRRAGTVSETALAELVTAVVVLREHVEDWLESRGIAT